VLWCLEALGVHAVADTPDVYRIEVAGGRVPPAGVPLHPYADLDGRRFAFAPAAGREEEAGRDVEQVTLQSPLTRWLWEELRGVAWPMQAAAARQPTSVHELTTPLFAPYSIEGGHMHLSGCSLEDRPFLRLSFLHRPACAEEPQVVHCFGTSDGDLLGPRMIGDLDLDQLVPLAGRLPRLASDVLRQWIEVTRRQFECQPRTGTGQLLAATLVWCKHAEGKLAFSIGAKSVEVAFAGWGRLLADRRVLPPPYECPLSGRNSYHLAATDDGRITVAESIAVCAESSRRVLVDELESCAETGRRVLPEYLQTCPVTGKRVLASVLQPCALCQQRVSPRALEGQRCLACRQMVPATKADPRMARILDAYPKLDRWRNWKIAETRRVQILMGLSALRRVLVVLDKQTLDVLHVAGSARLSGRWTTATDGQRREWVGC
jgi:hypothetical protein